LTSMDAISLLAILFLVAIALAIVLYPLIRPDRQPNFRVNVSADTAGELRARYGATLSALKDLEFDLEMSKISAEDYQIARLGLVTQAAKLLQQVEQVEVLSSGPTALDLEIEGLVAELNLDGGAQPPLWAADVEAELAALKTASATATQPSQKCPRCGQAARGDDSFCAACGAPLALRCQNCNHVLLAGDQFGTHCGQPLLIKESTG
jgi:phage FluMu protein Com